MSSDKWTEHRFCLELEKLYWSYLWSPWKRIKFEINWVLGKYRGEA